MATMPESRRLLAVLVLGLVARVVVMAPGFGRLDDPDRYLPLSREIAQGHGLRNWDGTPTAARPPLYPLLLAPLVGGLDERHLPAAIAALHVVLGLGATALTYLTARRWGFGPGPATLASAIAALDPVSLAQSRVVMTEPLAAFLVAACLAVTTARGRLAPLGWGMAFGLAGLCRPSLLPGAGLAVLARVAVGPGPLKQRAVQALVFAVAIVATLSPWAIRNARAFGEPVWTTTHGGYTLALANNPGYYADVVDGPPGSVWSGPNQEAWFAWVHRATVGMTGPQADRFLQSEGWRMLRERPGTFLRASVARLGRFWGLAPEGAVYSRTVRCVTAMGTAPVWVALALGLARRGLWRWPQVVAPAAILGLTAVHALFWTDMRMRAPVEPAIALVAGGAASMGWRKIARAGRISAVQTGTNR